MKGVSYITDKHSRKKAVVIDLVTLNKFGNRPHDLFDPIIAELRAEEPASSWHIVKERLTKKAKL